MIGRGKEYIKETINRELDSAFETARYIYDNPELGYAEVKSSARLCADFQRYGFAVESGIYGIPTAFRAVYDSGMRGPVIGFCAEYDALPEIGHGCGHNLVGTMALLGAVGLAAVLKETGGRIVVYGTPAEETSGSKVKLVNAGAFHGTDVVMMAHPSSVTEQSGSSLAMNALKFQYFGKTAHASASPEKGVNALDGVLLLFNGINALRPQLPRDVRIHGIISSGGMAPNVVPDFAEAKFYVRAPRKALLAEVVKKVKSIAHGAEDMTGARVEISDYECAYDDLLTNQALNRTICANLDAIGDHPRRPQPDGGSLDLGNVSYVVPSAHVWIGFGEPELSGHTREFAVMTISPKGKRLLQNGACALALSGYDLITQPELLKEIKKEFKSAVRG